MSGTASVVDVEAASAGWEVAGREERGAHGWKPARVRTGLAARSAAAAAAPSYTHTHTHAVAAVVTCNDIILVPDLLSHQDIQAPREYQMRVYQSHKSQVGSSVMEVLSYFGS